MNLGYYLYLQGLGLKDEEEIEEFLSWAFGYGYELLLITESHNAWNKLHPDLFVLYGSDLLSYSYERMVKAFLEHKKEQQVKGK